jgi:hypothetical protein
MTIHAPPLPVRRFVCVDCAAVLLASGGERVAPAEITWGTACEAHPRPAAPGATHVIEGGTPPERETQPGEDEDELPASDPIAEGLGVLAHELVSVRPLGPLTDITTRLVVAWSTEERGVGAEILVPQAVRIARMILRHTRGR